MLGITCKEAIARWEKEHGEKATEAEVIELQFQFPPIEKMDQSLSTLKNCEKLGLSSNMIYEVQGLDGLKKLKILSLGRNYIKSVAGIKALADTLEEFRISFNHVSSLQGLEAFQKLRVLYVSYNRVAEWTEVDRLQNCGELRDLVFVGNPLHEEYMPDERLWRRNLTRRLPQIKILDGRTIYH